MVAAYVLVGFQSESKVHQPVPSASNVIRNCLACCGIVVVTRGMNRSTMLVLIATLSHRAMIPALRSPELPQAELEVRPRKILPFHLPACDGPGVEFFC